MFPRHPSICLSPLYLDTSLSLSLSLSLSRPLSLSLSLSLALSNTICMQGFLYRPAHQRPFHLLAESGSTTLALCYGDSPFNQAEIAILNPAPVSHTAEIHLQSNIFFLDDVNFATYADSFIRTRACSKYSNLLQTILFFYRRHRIISKDLQRI